MANVFVKPSVVDGKPVLVRDPVSKKPLAAGGEWKTGTQFWRRRIRDKDVVDATAEHTEAKPAPASKSSK